MNYPAYQPNYQQPIQPTQPQMQPQQQQVTQQTQGVPIREVRFVTSDEARAYIVFPNSNALLIDSPNGMAYLKTADNMGQSFTEYFRFEKVNADGSPIAPNQEVKKEPQIDLSMFVSKDDFSVLAEKVDSLQKRLTKPAKQTVKDEGDDK